MEKNILIQCISVYPDKPRLRKYYLEERDQEIYKSENGEYIEFEGVMTNEAPLKSIIKYLYDHDRRLDKVISLVSEKARTAKIAGKNQTSVEYLKDETDKYIEEIEKDSAKRYYDDYTKDNLFHYVEIDDNLDEKGVIDASIEVANKILEEAGEGNHVKLFIDFNGGQRYIPFMLWNISNLMKIRKITVERTMTMNSNNLNNSKNNEKQSENTSEEEHMIIQSMDPVFKMGNLIAGINEYKKYGRAEGLKDYFKDCHNEDINFALDKMTEFADNLQMCRVAYIFSDNRMKEFREILEKDYNTGDSYDALFAYVVQDIKNGYKDLLEDNGVINTIKWCINNDYIQQALTLFEAKLPEYFVETGIFEPVSEESKNEILKMRSENELNSINHTWFKLVRRMNSYDDKVRKILKEEFLKMLEKLRLSKDDYECVLDYQDDVVSYARGTTRCLLPYGKNNNEPRAVTVNSLSEKHYLKLTKIIFCYDLIRYIRNETSHANGSENLMKTEGVIKIMRYELDLLKDIPDLKKDKGVENE